MSKYARKNISNRFIQEIPDDSINNIYDVEKIMDKKYENGRLLYLVKWLDYPDSENTWEPLSHLTDVPELIEAFEKDYCRRLSGEKDLELNEKPTPVKQLYKHKAPSGNIKLDVPKNLKSAKNEAGRVYVLVEWRERIDGIQPADSYVLNRELREKYWSMLLDFYEDRLKFNNKYKEN
jgi:hypothetical protein